jgi:phosphatidylserine/phosphatidylglycerophosphate/cardiolipin synthase-like enzyme
MRSDATKQQHWAPADSRIADEPDAGAIHVDWLIDNCEAYASMLESVRNARESIWISQLAFDADCKALADHPDESAVDAAGENLLDAILAVSTQSRVGVRILLNSSLLLNTKRPLLTFLDGRKLDAGLVEVRGVSRFPQLLHAKIVIIDQRVAFLMGSPFVNGYWDSSTHSPVDHRRPHRELGGRPVHDVSVCVRGPVVRELADTFACLWNVGGLRDPAEGRPSGRGTTWRAGARLGMKVVTTAPGGRRGSVDSGSMETLDALLAGIARARSMIYIEHQYLSSRPVAEALRKALDREPALELILVVNQNPDVTAYRGWQNARLAEKGLLRHPRVGLFGLWSISSFDVSKPVINQVFVHSKVVIIDDEWAMVGSANLDGASLDSYGDDFSGRLGRRVFRDVRNFDVSIVFTSEASARKPNPIRELRERLWMEHLGDESFRAMESKANVAEWKALAALNVAALNAGAASNRSALSGTFILPYSSYGRPRAQLEDAGIRPSTPLDLRFDPGWLEISCSPNWVRNMFL